MGIKEVLKAVMIIVNAGLVPMLWGPAGIGKTSICLQIAKQLKITFKKIVANMVRLETLTGIPYNDNGFLKHSKPEWVPETEQGLLLLDEVTDASNAIQKTFYTIALEGQCGEHKLPSKWFRIMAGNRPEDGSGSSMLPAPLITRLVHLGVGCDVPNFKNKCTASASVLYEDWKDWAIESNLRYEVITYLRLHPDKLYFFQANPRTWEFMSKLLESADELNQSFLDPTMTKIFNGTVGPGIGDDFSTFLRIAKEIPNPKDCYSSPETTIVPETSGVQISLINALIYYADKKNLSGIVRYCQRMPKSLQYYAIKALPLKDVRFSSNAEYIQWYEINKSNLE